MQETLLFRTPCDIAMPVEEMDAGQCLDAVVQAEKMIAAAQAFKIRVLARFGSLRPPGRGGVVLGDGAREEVSIELGVAPAAALRQIAQAEDLVERLPGTVAALGAGDIDVRRARAMRELTEVLSPEDAQRVGRRVLAHGRRANHGRFRQAVRYQVIKADPQAAEARRTRARDRRDVTYMDGLDGMGTSPRTFRGIRRGWRRR